MSSAHDKHEAIVKRVSRKHEEDEHGGAWKVAFADFCLALMCLFLVLWVLAARNAEQAAAAVRTDGGRMFEDGGARMIQRVNTDRGSLISREPVPARGDTMQLRNASDNAENAAPPLSRARYESPAQLRQLAEVLAKLSEDTGLANNIQSVVTPYGLRVILHDTEKQGMFMRGSAFPIDRFRRLLRKMGPVFAQMENQMLIVGHTDSLQYADGDTGLISNWTLSNSRANAARYHLLAGGMPVSSTLQVVGMADRAPFDVSNPKADVNRRIELLILTTEQASSIAAMFGVPGSVTPLLPGVDSNLPDRTGLSALQKTLMSSH